MSTPPTSTTSPTLARAIAMVETSPMIGLDIETTHRDPKRGKIRLVQVDNGKETYVIDRFKVNDDVSRLFEALSEKIVVAHNAAFEWSWIYHHYGIALDNVRDTYLMARILTCGDMSVSCALEDVALRELDIELDKEMQKGPWDVEVLSERHLRYAADDAQVLLPLYETLEEQLEASGQSRVAEIENAALPAVAQMMLAGMPVDQEAWEAAAENASKELRSLNAKMLDAAPQRSPIPQTWALQGPDCKTMLRSAGIPVDGTTRKDLEPYEGHELVKRLFAYRKAKGEQRENLRAAVLELAPEKPSAPAPPWNFNSPDQVQDIAYELIGGYLKSTDEATLIHFTHMHPFFEELLEYRGLRKLVSTYGATWFGDAYHDGRVYPGWRQIGTATGRFSCTQPNAQNIPASHREFFVAPPGRTFVDVDYSQIEVRVYAVMVGEQALLDIFDKGADVYETTAARILGKEKPTREERNKAKALVLGLLYGLTPAGLPIYAKKNYEVTIEPKEAEDLVERFFEVYPNIAEDHESTLSDLNFLGSVDRQTITGRRRDDIRARNEAINMPIQGSAADGLKLAMAYAYHELKRFGGSAYIIAAIHDELLIECDEADAPEAEKVVTQAMLDAMDELLNSGEHQVRLKVSGGITKIWAKE